MASIAAPALAGRGEKRHGRIDESQADEGVADTFEPLTAAQAEALRERLAVVSPWRVVVLQFAAGLVCVVVAAAAGGRHGAASAAWGAAAVVLPQAVLARGLSGTARRNAVTAAFGFMVWELAKIGLAVAMLVAFARVVAHPSWPALLVTLVVCMKTSWLALFWQRVPAIRTTNATKV